VPRVVLCVELFVPRPLVVVLVLWVFDDERLGVPVVVVLDWRVVVPLLDVPDWRVVVDDVRLLLDEFDELELRVDVPLLALVCLLPVDVVAAWRLLASRVMMVFGFAVLPVVRRVLAVDDVANCVGLPSVTVWRPPRVLPR